MALRGVKPAAIEKRLKMFMYGYAGAGKTTSAIQFPRPYLIDTERGAENDEYVATLEKVGGSYFGPDQGSTDFDEVVKEVRTLLTIKHDYKTLIIDPMTTIYSSLLDSCAQSIKLKSKEKDVEGTEFGRHYSEANKKMKHLIDLLMRLDMNIVITSHAKNEYGQDMKVIGTTFDCYKKLDYLFDLVIELQKRGKERYALVKKTRIRSFEDGEHFPFSYNAFAEKYGRHVLERDAVAQELATTDQVKQIKHLVDIIKIESDIVQKWLDKAQATSFEEMESDKIQACINLMNKKLTTPTVTE